MAHSSRTWTGARTPQALKRVRQAARKRLVNTPRKSAAKTLVGKAVALAATGDAETTVVAMVQAVSALDRAAKSGAIHRNAADRRKSRLMLKINAALGGATVGATAKPIRQTGKLAAAKAARARVAAGKASKAKGEQTAAGKARAALTRSTRETQTSTQASESPPAEPLTKPTPARVRATDASKTSAPKARSTKVTAAKASTAKPAAAKASTAKPAAAKASTAKPAASKARATTKKS